jgi:hypothetical protein
MSINTSKYLLLVTVLLLFISCENDNNNTSSLFEVIDSKQSNVNFKNRIPVDKLTNSFVYEYVYNGGGVAVGDINNDGLDDLYFTSNLENNQLYLNKGDFEFENITEASNTKGNRGWSTGTCMVDINNDGLLDIYVCKSGPYAKPGLLANELFINKGNDKDGIPSFEEAAAEFGLNSTSNSIQAAFLDFDLDGDLDMYLMNHNPQTFSASDDPKTFSPFGDKFFVNENGKYVDKTLEVGIYSNSISYGLGIGVSDLNQDGWPDLYISNDYDEPDYMYINNQDGTFKETIKKSTNHISNFSMGNDIADFDNDGYVDILSLDMVSEDNYGMKTSMASMNPDEFYQNVEEGKHYQYMYNTLQKHSTHIDSLGIPFFSEVGQITGISNTDWSWAPLLADFDNDGLKDIFITNGIKKDFRNKDFYNMMLKYRADNYDALINEEKIMYLLNEMPNRPQKNYFYKNNGDLHFSNMSKEWCTETEPMYSNGAAYADLDNDGDLDVVINNVDEKATILKNNTNNSKTNYLSLNFRGFPKNSYGIGAKTIVYTNADKQVFENYAIRGYQSSVPPRLHIGLGNNSKIDSVEIIWPNNTKQKIKDIASNQSLTLNYNENDVTQSTLSKTKNPLFSSTEILSDIKHVENDYDDYKEQVLLPHKLSQFGPAIAIGDINGDGREDLFIGQSTGTASIIYVQNNLGQFILNQTFTKDAIYEDVDAKFFDYDLDGDLDLYVASGGNEFKANSANYSDRIYENQRGSFIKRNDLLPKEFNISSSSIEISDFDNNGYPDLFIGARHIPHDYPAAASSVLLANNKGTFKDVTGSIAEELNDIGLITDAAWTDFDGDGDKDLCVVGEWMAPTFFQNNDNSFKKINLSTLDSLSGWYYTIKPIDIDSDGDDDYILGNLGDNYKYKANSEEPFEVYYHDFDENGKKDLVLGYYNFGELFPVRGKSCSTQQMPNIKQITPTYDLFGKSTIKDIYGDENLINALHLTCYNFKSGILKNNGNNNFEFHPLPSIAQISSINDILTKDINNDGLVDLIIAGNLFTSEIETPRNDAGYGMVLMNQGNFSFKSFNSNETGLFIPYDSKQLNWISINQNDYLISGNNNSKISVFKYIDQNQSIN